MLVLRSTSALRPLPASRRMYALGRAAQKDSEKTFALQRSLPRLPVPALEASVERYLRSLEPLLKDKADRGLLPSGATLQSELARRREWAADFLKPHGLAQTLQARLIDVDRRVPDNWLDDAYWMSYAYHGWRAPLPVNSNWWILMAPDPDIPREVAEAHPETGTFTDWQMRRAARLASRFLEFKDRLDRQDILPDSSRAARWSRPWMLYRMYGVTRIPSIPADHITSPAYPHPSRHICVIARGQIYTLQVVTKEGKSLSADEIESGLWAVVNDLENRPASDMSGEVSILTGGDRDAWTHSRDHLLTISPTKNRAAFTAIEDSLFVVCLEDSTRPGGLDGHIVTASANGDGRNRWFDKAMSIIVENNSRGSFSGEHSPCDALIPSIVSDYAQAEGVGNGPCNAKLKTGEAIKNAVWERVIFEVDDKSLKSIEETRKLVKGIQDDSDGKMLWFDEFGADWIKKTGKQPPDAWIQMAIQLAWYRQMGRVTPTYETASCRLFRKGRTDVIRTLSNDSLAFVKCMNDSSCDVKERFAKLSAATAAHNAYTRDASVGKACDRHFLGLKMVHRLEQDGPLPPLMGEDELFSESQVWELSTSGLSAGDRFDGTGFGTVYHTGYDLAGSKVIKFGIESKHSDPKTSTEQFRQYVAQAMRDMKQVCLDANQNSDTSLSSSTGKEKQGEAKL